MAVLFPELDFHNLLIRLDFYGMDSIKPQQIFCHKNAGDDLRVIGHKANYGATRTSIDNDVALQALL